MARSRGEGSAYCRACARWDRKPARSSPDGGDASLPAAGKTRIAFGLAGRGGGRKKDRADPVFFGAMEGARAACNYLVVAAAVVVCVVCAAASALCSAFAS